MRIDRDQLRETYAFRCGYCGTTEASAGAELTVDHFRPRSRHGSDDADNLVYCCHACNEFKGDFWNPDGERRILHPLRDDMTFHMQERQDGTWEGLTTTGEFHIERLRLNRPALVAQRLRLHEQAALLQELHTTQERVRRMEAEIDRLWQILEG